MIQDPEPVTPEAATVVSAEDYIVEDTADVESSKDWGDMGSIQNITCNKKKERKTDLFPISQSCF